MNKNIYDDIVCRLAKKYKISDLEIERIVDSQFKVLLETLGKKGIEVVQLKHLGKFQPVKRILENAKKNNTGLGGLE